MCCAIVENVYNIKIWDATNTRLITRLCWNLKNTQSDFGRGLAHFVVWAARVYSRESHWFSAVAHRPNSLHQTAENLSENTTRTYLRTHYGHSRLRTCARGGTAWVGSCICGRGAAYSCRVLIVNWFRSTRDSGVLSTEKYFNTKKLSRTMESSEM